MSKGQSGGGRGCRDGQWVDQRRNIKQWDRNTKRTTATTIKTTMAEYTPSSLFSGQKKKYLFYFNKK